MFGLVFALKLALALTLADHPLLQPAGDLDTGEYWRLAQRVAAGDLALTGTPFYVSPLYIYWLGAAMVVSGGSVTGVLVLQAVAGTTAVLLVALTARRWLQPVVPTADDDRRARIAAVVAGAAMALTGIVALQEALILQSAIDPLLMAAVAFTCTTALLEPSSSRWLACGVACALLATNRPNAWALAVVCLASAAVAHSRREPPISRWRLAAAWVLGVTVVLLPFTLRTRVATGQWQWLAGHGGLNAYIGNHPGASGTYTVVDGIRPSIEGQRDDARRVAEAAVGRPLSDAAVSAWFVGRALHWWRDAPAEAVGLFAYKLWLSTHAWELPVNVSYGWFREQVLLLRLLPIGAWLLVPLGLAALVVGRAAVAADHGGAWRWFQLLLPAYLIGVAAFFVVDRYRAPALVLCAVHVGVVAGAARGTALRGHRLVAGGLVAVVSLGAGLIPLPFHLGHGDADLGMALHAIDAHRDAEANSWLSRAAARHSTPGVVWFRAGLAWQSRNAWPEAERALREAHRLDPEVGDVSFALAGVLLAQGRGAGAVPLLEAAERLGVRRDRVRLDRALALWQAGDEAAARRVLEAGVPAEGLPLLRARALAAVEARQVALAAWLLGVYRGHAPGDAEVSEKLGLMQAQRGAVAEAETMLEEAARLDPSRATARFNLAIIRARQGRRAEAITLLREALTIDPTYAQAAGALRELLNP